MHMLQTMALSDNHDIQPYLVALCTSVAITVDLFTEDPIRCGYFMIFER